jgi:hypothetical protein
VIQVPPVGQDDEIGTAAELERAGGQLERTGGHRGQRRHSLGQRHSGSYRVAQCDVLGERAARDGASVRQPGDTIAHRDVQSAEQVVAVAHPGRGDGIGDKRDPPGGHPHDPGGERRVNVHGVEDELTRGLAFEQGADDARLALMQRPHRIEQVGTDRGPGGEPGTCLVVRGVGVPDGCHRAAVDNLGYRLERSGQLRGDRDHAHGASSRVEQGGHRGSIGRAQQGRVVRAAAGRGKERAFEMDAGHKPRRDQRRERRNLLHQLGNRRGDQAGQARGGAVPPVEVDHRVRVVRESGPSASVHVHVDEPGCDVAPAKIDAVLPSRT